ncbi:tyrosine-type recombinase/integrase [Rubripirellula reticaptiva]|uniref:Site-specific tyrosine recombinase XerD n=1 Tax=Rubripirellula reticaptiva TaxID=2528013 RepID=A0A5C6F7D9_9BACT|nr:site-specific integrase [Rubripirellula reticaptiva]TWU56026.1 site-specific tyrosine recombinase XerD [Rubripirellula reticaptiva]
MAWLQNDPSGNFHISFRFAGRKYKRSLKTKNETEAQTRLHRLEENIRLVESGRLELPDNADAPIFLLSDGKLESKRSATERVQLSGLFQRYFDGIPDDALEDTTVDGMKTHQTHLERHIGARFPIDSLTRETLQTYVQKRAKAPGIRGRKLSPATIRKELVTLRSVWNWALAESIVATPYPLKGVRFPKTDEKPHFQTMQEIADQIERGNLDEAASLDLWDCLFLTREQIEELLDYVEQTANHPFIYPMFVAAAHTGVRRSELMRSQFVDFNATHMVVREKKRVRGQRSTRRVPMSDRLTKAIKQWRTVHPGGLHTFCIPDIARSKKSRESLLPITRNEANDHFQRTLAGSKWEVIRGWHCLRHSFCSNCASQGVDQRIIDAWVGHTTEAMRKRYRHLFPTKEQEVIKSVFG